jgi:hypothetical protein
MTASASSSAVPSTRDQFEGAFDVGDLPPRLRDANDFMARALGDEGPRYEIAFFCECGHPDCHLSVWLTAAEFHARVIAGQPIT